MANPVKQFETMLRQHRFELVRQSKHLVYRNPEGKILVTAKTPSDHRAANNMLTTLRRVVESPPPSSELIEEERQRKALEATITLTMTVKPLEGISGAGKGAKSKGTGFTYYDPEEGKSKEERERKARLKAERLAWLQSPEGLAWREQERTRRLEEKEREEIRRAWTLRVARFRERMRELREDKTKFRDFYLFVQLMRAARYAAANILRANRKQFTRVQTGDVLDMLYQRGRDALVNDGAGREDILSDAEREGMPVTYLVLHRTGRLPSWAVSGGEWVNVNAMQLRILRRAVAAEGPGTPEWIKEGLMMLNVGMNKIEDGDPGGT